MIKSKHPVIMKIGIVTAWFERGAAYVSRAYKDALQAEGHDVFIYARGGESLAIGDPEWDSDKVFWAKKTLMADESGIDLRLFRQWLISTGIEVILFNEQRTWAPVIECQKLGIPSVAYVDYYTKDNVRLFANYDALICNTKRHYLVFEWHPRSFFVPWGVDTELFKPAENWLSKGSRRKPVFFHSCGMSPVRKGTDLLVAAFNGMEAGSAELIIHAQNKIFGLLPDAIGRIAKKLQEEGHLRIIYETVPAPGLYHLGDVYVYPSRLDGIGLTICEAISCGLPVIVPDNPPMNEFVQDEMCGRRVRVDKFYDRYDGYYWPSCSVDINSLKEAMNYYVENFDLIDSFKKGARDYVLGQRRWMSHSANISSIFKSVSVMEGGLRDEGRALVRSQISPYSKLKSFIIVNAKSIGRSSKILQKMYDRYFALKEVSKGS